MADTKISALTAASALAAADIAPVVQGGANVKATVQQIVTAATGSTAFRGETLTTSKPAIDLAQTWNASGVTFTGVKFNATDTASAAGSLLMDLQVGGVSQSFIDKAGIGNFGSSFSNRVRVGYSTAPPSGEVGMGLWAVGGGKLHLKGYAELYLGAAGTIGENSAGAFGFASSSRGAFDVLLARDAAGTLAQRNGTNAQTFRLYNTFTDASNYERGFMRWNSNVLEIGSEGAGTGVGRTMRFVGSNPLQTVTFNGVTFQNFYSTEARGAVLISENIGLTTKNNYAVVINTLSNTESRLWLSASTNIQLTFEISAVKKNYFGSYAGAGHNLLIKAGQGSDQSGATNAGGNLLIRGGAGSNGGADGLVIMDNLPTVNPLVTGALWNNAGVLSISAG